MTQNYQKVLSKVGFWGLAGSSGWLMLRTFSYILDDGKFKDAILIAWIGLLFFYTIISERVLLFKDHRFLSLKEHSAKQYAGNFLAVLIGTVITFWLNHSIGLGGVIASSLVGVAASMLFPRHAAPVYCGSFVGMACNVIFSSPVYILLAGILSGMLYVLGEESFQGIGGRLGTTAFFGTFTASSLIQRPLRIISAADENMLSMVFFGR